MAVVFALFVALGIVLFGVLGGALVFCFVDGGAADVGGHVGWVVLDGVVVGKFVLVEDVGWREERDEVQCISVFAILWTGYVMG